MQTKNKLLFSYLLILFFFTYNAYAEEFNITAQEISIDKEKEIITGTGSVKAIDSLGKEIHANKIIYQKKKEFLSAEGNVKILDVEGNILRTDKATYDKINELIITYDTSELILKEGYKLITKSITYDTKDEILSSSEKSIFNDPDGNIIETTMFQYDKKNNLFSSVGEIKILDIKKNKYFFKEFHADTKEKEMFGSDISVILDQSNFGVSEENDPRFVANDIFLSKDKINLSKGVFTVCKKRDGKCPPWSLRAKKITHDSIKKTIYYDHAILKVYDIPIFYFPKFFHPDPTIKRQSGFLVPLMTNTTNLGTGFGLPYYWAINNDKDLTFTPKIYKNENALFLNEYRQAFKKGFFTLDTGYTAGYKNTSDKKTGGSRTHVFANLDMNFSENDLSENNLLVKIQRSSNDTYFRVHDINTSLVSAENTNLENEINYNFSKDDTYLSVVANAFEDLRKEKNDRYEFIFPNIMFGKTFFNEKFGTFNFRSNAFYNNYDVNKHKKFFTNDLIWTPFSYITSKGFVNTVEGMIRNTNYKTEKTKEYKDGKTVNELSSVISFKNSLPMKKDNFKYSKLFSPNFMIRYAPGHMRNLSSKDEVLNYTNLYALNKTSEIEDGLSAILGIDYKINEKQKDGADREKLSLSVGQVFNHEENEDLPSKSSLDQKTSDIVGEINYNFSKIGNIDYKFSLDHNLNNLNYNEVSTELNFNKIAFNLDYLEEQNHRGSEHYASSGISLNFNDNNKLSFSTKKNFKTDSTELYDLSYQYNIDCLTAGLVYRREFYEDADLETKNTLMFTITFVPFSKLNAPINP
tara:strand:- start:5352 stop:7769 length:2418 start_codon:yes stop_codon:yes gene_type:complete